MKYPLQTGGPQFILRAFQPKCNVVRYRKTEYTLHHGDVKILYKRGKFVNYVKSTLYPSRIYFAVSGSGLFSRGRLIIWDMVSIRIAANGPHMLDSSVLESHQ